MHILLPSITISCSVCGREILEAFGCCCWGRMFHCITTDMGYSGVLDICPCVFWPPCKEGALVWTWPVHLTSALRRMDIPGSATGSVEGGWVQDTAIRSPFMPWKECPSNPSLHPFRMLSWDLEKHHFLSHRIEELFPKGWAQQHELERFFLKVWLMAICLSLEVFFLNEDSGTPPQLHEIKIVGVRPGTPALWASSPDYFYIHYV